MSEVTSASMIAVITDLAPSTYNRAVSALLAILNLARASGWLQEVPRFPRRKVKGGRVRWLTSEEWSLLQTKLPAHLLPLARFSIATGLRRRNVTHLEWSQVDMNRRVAARS